MEEAVSDRGTDITAAGLLLEHIDDTGGPPIHADEEQWQDELDLVCRKLFKFFKEK